MDKHTLEAIYVKLAEILIIAIVIIIIVLGVFIGGVALLKLLGELVGLL